MKFKPEDFDNSGDGPLRQPAHEIANKDTLDEIFDKRWLEAENARLRGVLEALRADLSRTIDLSVNWSEVGFDACSTVISRETLVKLQAALKGEN